MKKTFKSILITGASSGIGEGLALHYAASGVSLFLGGRNTDRLDAVAGACTAKGAIVHTHVGDVADEDAMRRWIYKADQTAPLNLVVANAGVATFAPSVDALHEAATTAFAANVGGLFNTVHPALELMARRRPYPVEDAQIAIIASVMGYLGTARSPAYSASKAVARNYGQALRAAFRKMGIGVTVICPGYVATPMMGNSTAIPFTVSTERAVKVSARAIARNRARVTFPWQVLVLAKIVTNLPNFMVDWINRPYGAVRLEEVDE